VSVHLNRAIEHLKTNILSLGTTVEETVWKAVRSVGKRDAALAEQVVQSDDRIDEFEVDIEEECLKILALHQPVAIDLRFIVAVLKINNDLERIADLAVNIAERAVFLAAQDEIDLPFDFPGMAKKAQWMLRKSLDALVNLDANLACKVCTADDEVDQINREMYDQVKRGIRQEPEHVEQFIHLLCVSRHIERIADHATNIAQDVLYMVRGEIVRHRHECYLSDSQPDTQQDS